MTPDRWCSHADRRLEAVDPAEEMFLGNEVLKAERLEQLLLHSVQASHHRAHPRRWSAQIGKPAEFFNTIGRKQPSQPADYKSAGLGISAHVLR
jgi:hypothetical protein